jgi:hypothetical protein
LQCANISLEKEQFTSGLRFRISRHISHQLGKTAELFINCTELIKRN